MVFTRVMNEFCVLCCVLILYSIILNFSDSVVSRGIHCVLKYFFNETRLNKWRQSGGVQKIAQHYIIAQHSSTTQQHNTVAVVTR